MALAPAFANEGAKATSCKAARSAQLADDACLSSIAASVVTEAVARVTPELRTALTRSADFVAKYRPASRADAPTLILLHGSGGNEESLMALAEKAVPGAALLGIRGRVVQDGVTRWYKRITPTRFDQADIRAEADAFATFLAEAGRRYEIDLDRAIFLGYSNGANLLGALSVLHPGLIHKAALLRPMRVLEKLPKVDLAKASFLTVAGKDDKTYGPLASNLDSALAGFGAAVDARTVGLGHLLGDADASAVAAWLTGMERPEPATVTASK